MSLEYKEFKKLYTNRFVLVVYGVIFVLNALTSYYVYMDNEQGKRMYTPDSYRQVYEDIGQMGTESAYAYLRNCLNNLTEKMQSGQTLKLSYTDSIEEEILLLSEVQSNFQQTMHYDDYLDGIVRQADKTQYSGMVGVYAQRDIQQRLQDIEQIRGISVSYGPSKGIELFSSLKTTDFYVVVLFLVLVVQMVTRERESGELSLYKATYHGRMRLAISKLIILLTSVLGITLLLQGTNYILGQKIYGFGDLHRAIQSVDAFISCTHPLSVGQFLVLFFGGKFLIYAMLALFALWVAIEVKYSVVFYGINIIVYGTGMVCSYTIHSSSVFAFWKYVNVFALLDVGNIIGKYQNLNVFKVPYSYPGVFLVIVFALTVVLGYLALNRFSVQNEADYVYKKERNQRLCRLGKHNSIFLWEMRKLFVNGRWCVLLVLYSFFVLFTYKPVEEAFSIQKDAYYDAYIDYLKGPVSNRTEMFIARENQKYEWILQNGEKLSGNAYAYHMLPYEAFTQIRDSATPYLKRVKGEYLRDTGYRLLTGDDIANKKDIKLAVMAVLMLIYPLSYIYGMEYQQGTNVLLKMTCHGRGKTRGIKTIHGLLVIISVYLLTYVPFYYSVLSEYGTESIHAPACSLQHLMKIPHDVSILEYLVFVAVMRCIGFILMMLLIFYLSGKIKSVIKTCLVAVLLVVLPLVFAYLQIPGGDFYLLNPFFIGNIY